jgi:hypothetical protein
MYWKFTLISTILNVRIITYIYKLNNIWKCTLHLKMLTRSSDIVNLKARAEWWDSNTHTSLYRMASSWFELQRKALKQIPVHTHYHFCHISQNHKYMSIIIPLIRLWICCICESYILTLPLGCGERPHSGFSPSTHALRSGRMWEAVVRGATGRLQLTARETDTTDINNGARHHCSFPNMGGGIDGRIPPPHYQIVCGLYTLHAELFAEHNGFPTARDDFNCPTDVTSAGFP